MRTYNTLVLATIAVATVACGTAESPKVAKQPVVADVVELDSAQMAAAGVAFTTVGPLPADTIYLTGTITFDAARVSHVASRIQGRIRGARFTGAGRGAGAVGPGARLAGRRTAQLRPGGAFVSRRHRVRAAAP